jgi:hypothetical protein
VPPCEWFLRAGKSVPHPHGTAVRRVTRTAAHGAEPRWSVAAPPGLGGGPWERVREVANCRLTSATVRVERDGAIRTHRPSRRGLHGTVAQPRQNLSANTIRSPRVPW